MPGTSDFSEFVVTSEYQATYYTGKVCELIALIKKLRGRGVKLTVEEWVYCDGADPVVGKTAKVDGVRREKEWEEQGWSDGLRRAFRS